MKEIYSNKSYKNKKKQSLMKLFLALLFVVIVTSFGLVSTEFHADRLMTTYVSVDEVVSELQFTVYTKEEWKEFFSDYKETYLTREMVFGNR